MFSNTPVNAYMDMKIPLFNDFLESIAAVMEERDRRIKEMDKE